MWLVEHHDYDNGDSGPLILAYKKYPPLTTKLAMKVAEDGVIEWYYPHTMKKVLPEDVHYNDNLDGEHGWSYRHYVDGEPTTGYTVIKLMWMINSSNPQKK